MNLQTALGKIGVLLIVDEIVLPQETFFEFHDQIIEKTLEIEKKRAKKIIFEFVEDKHVILTACEVC
jgi:transcription initiation factor IIE alpha subunit